VIAISYRREDSTPVAGRLHDRLRAEFGKENVFMDFDSIPYGVDFREHIKRTLERADVVVAVVGPGWLGAQKEASRRIDDPSDFVRLEIAGALHRGIPVIPVLVDDTPMPKPDALPPDMQAFAFRNALMLDTGIDFHHHADRLVAGIRELLENAAAKTTITPAEPKRTEAVERTQAAPPQARKFDWKQKQMAMVGGGLVLAAAICFGIVMFKGKRSTKETRSTSPISETTPAVSTTPAQTTAPIVAAMTPTSPSPVTTVAQSTAAPVATETVSANSVANSPPSMQTPSSSVASEPVYATTPFVSSVDETEAVRQFVRDYHAALSRHDLDSVLSMFADDVDYQGQGHHDRRYIRNDIGNYFRRWDRIYFEVGDIDVSHTRDGDLQVRFSFPFAVGQGHAPDKRGVSSQVWTVRKNSQGNLQIVSQREKVIAGGLETRRRRR
jgi:ketosteroid isomerase-like protein